MGIDPLGRVGVPLLFCLLAAICGCGKRPEMAPVSGKVLLDGEPLQFGYVIFQPERGQPAQGEIGADGSFSLSSREPGDGALIGSHKISVLCYEGHEHKLEDGKVDPHASLGRSLIPLPYTRSGMSQLTADVPEEGLSGHVIELSMKGPSR